MNLRVGLTLALAAVVVGLPIALSFRLSTEDSASAPSRAALSPAEADRADWIESRPPYSDPSVGETQAARRYRTARDLLATLGGRGGGGALARLRAFCEAWAAARRDHRDELLERFLAGLDFYAASLDPGEIPGVLAGLNGPIAEEMLLPLQRVLFRELAENDPRMAAMLTESLLSGTTRDLVRLEVALAWADADVPSAAAWLAQWPEGTVRDIAVETIATFLADSDPREASAWLAAVPAGPIRTALLEGLFSQGGGRAFETALDLAQRLPEGPEKERALVHLSYQWEQRDFQAALAYARSRPRSSDAFAVTLVNQWAIREPRAAADWAVMLPEGELRQKVLSSLTATWAQLDARAAAEYVLFRLPPGATQEQAAISVVSAWAAQDPRAAAQWLEHFPTGPLRSYAMENLIYPWANSDPAAAIAWLARVPAGPTRDAALNAGFGRLIDAKPDLAAQWAVAISDEKLRVQKSEQAARAWLASDAPAARHWIVASSLPLAVKQQLLARDAP